MVPSEKMRWECVGWLDQKNWPMVVVVAAVASKGRGERETGDDGSLSNSRPSTSRVVLKTFSADFLPFSSITSFLTGLRFCTFIAKLFLSFFFFLIWIKNVFFFHTTVTPKTLIANWLLLCWFTFVLLSPTRLQEQVSCDDVQRTGQCTLQLTKLSVAYTHTHKSAVGAGPPPPPPHFARACVQINIPPPPSFAGLILFFYYFSKGAKVQIPLCMWNISLSWLWPHYDMHLLVSAF